MTNNLAEKIKAKDSTVVVGDKASIQNADKINNYFLQQDKITRIFQLEKFMQKEITGKECVDALMGDIESIKEELNYLRCKIDESEEVDLKMKLELANREKDLSFALRLKEKIYKKIESNSSYTSANGYFAHILSFIIANFRCYVYPALRNDISNEEIDKIIYEKVIVPTFEEVQTGINFFNFNYSDIFGMVYFLAGNCHLWFDKEHV